MSNGHVIRGARVGSAPPRHPDRHPPVACRSVSYWCRNGHRIDVRLAADVAAPPVWDCTRCGQPAGEDAQHPPERSRAEPYKTHLAYVKERRTEAEGEALLAEALAALRQRRNPR
ncbi:RNA polymerase-binding protein RbpA [Micromonospora endophytica]|uniref:RNA polymerase-binding protein RbpA n=1 Tax=Micromonospora endophytica TaxID=515350 RepID=A0A2W2DQA2_9ACTN|nr:RNA polymerase-binding protein RbpA [Micromonospora endophytica]PZF99336.1 electron transporter [Micromonospora endophytica]RIW43019.1 RNA polymerase-binding protein RbpA [Micromonospora endophytica]BCJ61320.1 RNA polymerase-binding protein RbpA [Micromonospora endophytica]